MGLKHAIYMNEMKKRQAAKEEKMQKKAETVADKTSQNTVKTRRHRLPR